jgi:copper(I)-binding protein
MIHRPAHPKIAPARVVAMAAFALTALLAGRAQADTSTIAASQAWTPVQAQAGVDTPVYMSLANTGNRPDTLLRVRCPVATFTEFRVLDHGEGVPAPRLVKSLPVAVGQSALNPDGPRIMLLQTIEPLPTGARFTCTLTFQNAGSVGVAIQAGESAQAASN